MSTSSSGWLFLYGETEAKYPKSLERLTKLFRQTVVEDRVYGTVQVEEDACGDVEEPVAFESYPCVELASPYQRAEYQGHVP